MYVNCNQNNSKYLYSARFWLDIEQLFARLLCPHCNSTFEVCNMEKVRSMFTTGCSPHLLPIYVLSCRFISWQHIYYWIVLGNCMFSILSLLSEQLRLYQQPKWTVCLQINLSDLGMLRFWTAFMAVAWETFSCSGPTHKKLLDWMPNAHTRMPHL